ncbi:MAG TPA: SDR family oxidoreductase [Stellaceae bacterium]|nr:SDR family oxidoreductase [Stellaceae bacterium]
MTDGSFRVDFTGQAAFITGAGGGISRAVALAFAASGASVFAVDRNLDGAAATAAAIRERGGEAEACRADVSVSREVDDAVAAAVRRFGRIDHAFNGAGIGSPIAGSIVDYSDADWDAVMGVNLRGMFFCLRAEIRQMLAQGGGGIVNVASYGGFRASPNAPAYITSKHGVVGLTRATALDCADKGIRINAICPGFIGGTAMMDAFIEKDPEVRLAAMSRMIPMSRLGEVDEVAGMALWLCSEAARYVTGAAMLVDGGVTLK